MQRVSQIQKGILQSNVGGKSSKRHAGLVILGIGIIMGGILFGWSLGHKIADPEVALMVFKTNMYTGGGLLGLGIFELFGKKTK